MHPRASILHHFGRLAYWIRQLKVKAHLTHPFLSCLLDLSDAGTNLSDAKFPFLDFYLFFLFQDFLFLLIRQSLKYLKIRVKRLLRMHIT